MDGAKMLLLMVEIVCIKHDQYGTLSKALADRQKKKHFYGTAKQI